MARMAESQGLQVSLSEPTLLVEFRDFLSREGYAVIDWPPDSVEVLVPTHFTALLLLMAKIGMWRAARPEVTVTMNR